jgi:uncharacterized repeat protein (TIGR03943 family)
MKEKVKNILLILMGLYIAVLIAEPRRIFTYTYEGFYWPILLSGIILIAVGILDFVSDINRDNIQKVGSKEIGRISLLSKTREFKLIIILLLLTFLGIFISPLFLLFAAIIFLLDKSKITIFLKNTNFRITLILILIITGIIFPSNQISSNAANQRIGNLNSVNLDNNLQIETGFSVDTKKYDIGDWVASINFNPDLDNYVSKDVDVIGFVFHADYLDNDTFIVGRFVIRCCAADATPTGLRVYMPGWQNKFREDEWIRVEGKFERKDFGGYEDLIIIPSNIEKTEIPEKPYVD